MYRRANLTGVNPLVYYLEEEGCAWDVEGKGMVRGCLSSARTKAMSVQRTDEGVYLVLLLILLLFLMGIYDLVISSYFD